MTNIEKHRWLWNKIVEYYRTSIKLIEIGELKVKLFKKYNLPNNIFSHCFLCEEAYQRRLKIKHSYEDVCDFCPLDIGVCFVSKGNLYKELISALDECDREEVKKICELIRDAKERNDIP